MKEFIIPEKTRERKKRKSGSGPQQQLGLIIFTLVVIALISYGAYSYFIPKKENFVLDFYTYAHVDTGNFLETLTAKGTVLPRKVELIAPKIAGTIEEVFVQEGQDVNEGDPLLRLYSAEVVNEKNNAETELGEAQAKLAQLRLDQELELANERVKIADSQEQLNQAKDHLALQKILYDYGSIARVELEKAEQSLETAKRRLEQGERELELLTRRHEADRVALEKIIAMNQEKLKKALKQMDEFLVKAPFPGRVLSLKIPNNRLASAYQDLGELADLTDQIVELQVSPNQVGRFGIGTSVNINLGSTEYKAKVTYIAPQARQGSDGPSVLVRADFLEEAAQLRPNSSVTAHIHLQLHEDSLFLPRGAYLTSGQQLFVYVIEGNIAKQREVQFGLLQGNAIQVLRGLERGEKVIISSYDSFRHLKEIEILPEGGHVL